MTHDYHEDHPRFSEAQVLYDGCEECARRSQDPEMAILAMTPFTFARAWKRAVHWAGGGLADASSAEIPVFRVLWAVRCQLGALGGPWRVHDGLDEDDWGCWG